MAEESDGIEEAFEGTLRVALTAAARVGEQVARQREAAARQAQAEGESAAAQLAGRLNAEREAARASYAPLHRPDWWDAAQPEDIARAYQTAKAWTDVDPEAVRAEQRIVEEVRSRYGVDLAAQATDPATVRDALDQAEQARADAGSQASAEQDDTLEGAQLLAEADAVDRFAEAQRATQEPDERTTGTEPSGVDHTPASQPAGADVGATPAEAMALQEEAGVAYDSADRRAEMADQLDGVADQATVEARVLADTSQARPATDATKTDAGRSPRARKGPKTPAKQVQRSGLTR